MSGTEGRSTSATLARDAADFIDRVERDAHERGADEPRLHHWVAAACDRPFLARTIAREQDVVAARALTREALAADRPGPRLSREKVLSQARETAIRLGDRQIRTWHLVLVVLQRFGIELRAAEDTPLPNGRIRSAPVLDPATTPDSAPNATGGEDDRVAATVGPAHPGSPGGVPARSHAGSPAPSTSKARRAPARTQRRATPLLDQCGSDWTAAAARGHLPPMVGRAAEMRLLIEGLCRPTKPNVLLVGEPGVGKSALVEGLAARIASGDVPDALAGRPLIALDMAELTRESRYHGVMEQRLATLIEEARAVRAILFIDEGHAMTGSGGREGTGDVASVLKPALARGDLSLISATTEDEYRRFIVPNGALERRFNVVRVLEPDRESVRVMLAAHRDAIATTHGVGVTDAALDRLLEITASRLSHRREPDRSRDLLDQAVARAIAAGATSVTVDDLDATARAVSGAPEVTDETLATLRRALVQDGRLTEGDAADLTDRLALTFTGLALHPQRPRAVVLDLRRPDGADGADGLRVAEALATHVFGAPERVVAIGVGGFGDPSAISGFLGTTQGYVGHGTTLPIHGLAERPHSVLLLRGVDAAHESFRGLLARALRDGYLTDAQARRIGLTQAIIVLEAAVAGRAGRRLGFGASSRALVDARAAGDPAPSTEDVAALAAATVGEDLAGECDLVVVPTAAGRQGADATWVARTLEGLATAYRAAGVDLSWDREAEMTLTAAVASAGARERERVLEATIARAVRPYLRSGRRRLQAHVRHDGGRLVADVEPGSEPSASGELEDDSG